MKSWYLDDSIDHITEQAVSDSTASLVEPGAVVICIRSGVLAHTLPVALNRVSVTLNQDLKALRCSDALHAPFLARFLKWHSPVLLQTVRGTTAHNLSTDVLRQTRVPLPPLPEQERIAAILDAADALRAKRRESIEQLDSLIQATFLEMFGDPVTNPMGWEVGQIGDLMAAVNYGTSKKAHPTDGAFPILRMGNITYEGGWELGDLKFIDLDKKERSKYLVQRGDILFNRTNSKELVGKTAVYRSDIPMAFAGYLVRAVTNERASPEYVGAFMNSRQMKASLQNMCKAIVGMANINASEFKAISIPIPPFDLQTRFASIIEYIEQQKARQKAHLAELDTLFASLQSRAFNGELVA
jgi:type I restriction enzyme S subunit